MRYATLFFASMILATASPQPLRNDPRAIRFGELAFAPVLRKIIVPGGETRKVALVDVDTQNTQVVGGFGDSDHPSTSSNEGLTSADACRGFIYVTDTATNLLHVVDPRSNGVVASVRLASRPSHVRFVAGINELWVTEPSSQRIEIFKLPTDGIPRPLHARFIGVIGGPESLAIDVSRKSAFANLSTDTTVSISIANQETTGRWSNGCRAAKGLALDIKRGFVFVACNEGGVTVLQESSGKLLGEVASGASTGVIAYSQNLGHLYVLEPEDGRLAIVGISKQGKGQLLKTVETEKRSNCVIADDLNHVYVCDPSNGRLFTFRDSLPPSP